MKYRNLVVAAALCGGLAGFCAAAGAETIAVADGIAVKPSDVVTPTRGMTMDQVSSKFGAPAAKVPAVGTPPISRWEYPGFVVYFESDHVIHSVVSDAPAPSDS
jgi:outer membrane protein assembly factor BamE (lipoprotein component of BamABCDE complex)